MSAYFDFVRAAAGVGVPPPRWRVGTAPVVSFSLPPLGEHNAWLGVHAPGSTELLHADYYFGATPERGTDGFEWPASNLPAEVGTYDMRLVQCGTGTELGRVSFTVEDAAGAAHFNFVDASAGAPVPHPRWEVGASPTVSFSLPYLHGKNAWLGVHVSGTTELAHADFWFNATPERGADGFKWPAENLPTEPGQYDMRLVECGSGDQLSCVPFTVAGSGSGGVGVAALPPADPEQDAITLSEGMPVTTNAPGEAGHPITRVVQGPGEWFVRPDSAWVEIDLGRLCAVGEVVITWWGTAVSGDFSLLAAPDADSELREQRTSADTAGPPEGYNKTTTVPGWRMPTRRVRLDMRSGHDDGFGQGMRLGIRHICVQGRPLSSWPPGLPVADLSCGVPVTCNHAEDGSHPVTNVVDRTDSEWWTTSDCAWIEVDLGQACAVSQVRIQWWGAAVSSDFAVLAAPSADTGLQQLRAHDDAAQPAAAINGWTTVPGWRMPTQRVRLDMRSGHDDGFGYAKRLGIRQIIVSGVALVPWLNKGAVNVAEAASVTSNHSDDGGRPIANVLNGPGHEWWTPSDNAWIEIDLGTPYAVDEVRITWWGTAVSGDFSLLAAPDADSELRPQRTNVDAAGLTAAYNGDTTVPGWRMPTQRLRLDMRSGHDDGFGKGMRLGIRQIVVRGSVAGVGAPGLAHLATRPDSFDPTAVHAPATAASLRLLQCRLLEVLEGSVDGIAGSGGATGAGAGAGAGASAGSGAANLTALTAVMCSEPLLRLLLCSGGCEVATSGQGQSRADARARWARAVAMLCRLLCNDAKAAAAVNQPTWRVRLAVATALTFCHGNEEQGPTKALAASGGTCGRNINVPDRYATYCTWAESGAFLPEFKERSAWEMRYVVGAWASDGELAWARAKMQEAGTPREALGLAYDGAVKVEYHAFHPVNGASVQDGGAYYEGQPGTMQVLHKEGGVCGARAKVGVACAQAWGVPAMPVAEPGHCSMVWESAAGVWTRANPPLKDWGLATAHQAIQVPWRSIAGGYACLVTLMQAAQDDLAKYAASEQLRLRARLAAGGTLRRGDEVGLGVAVELLASAAAASPANMAVWHDLGSVCRATPDAVMAAAVSTALVKGLIRATLPADLPDACKAKVLKMAGQA